jgi:hypothetical protein
MAKAPIQTILGYQTADGEQFHDLGAAQTHTRSLLHKSIHDHAIKQDTRFALLDKALLLDFLMAYDRVVAGVVAERFAPEPVSQSTAAELADAAGLKIANVHTGGPVASNVTGLRPAAPVTQSGRPLPEAVRPDPLKSAMQAVDSKMDEELGAEVSKIMSASFGV